MKKSNVILNAAIASALLVMAGSASAGVVSGGVTLATESVAAGAGSVVLTNYAANYQMSGLGATGQLTNVPAGVATVGAPAFTVYLKAVGGTFDAAVAAADFTAAAPTLAGGAVLVGTPVLSVNKDMVAVTVSYGATAAGQYFVPNTSVIAFKGKLAVTNVQAANVTMAGYADFTNAAVVAGFTALPAALTDSTATPATVLSVAAAQTGAVATTADGSKIDLTANPVGSAFTKGTAVNSTTVASLASVTFTNVATAPTNAGAAAAGVYTPAAATTVALPAAAAVAAAVAPLTGLSVTIAPAVGSAFTAGMTFKLTTDAACATAFDATATTTLAPVTAAVATTTTSVKIASTKLVGNKAPVYVCVTAPAPAAAMTPATFTVAATSGATGLADTVAATNGDALAYNGQQIDIRNYVPAANVGWTNYLRIINTGSVNATVSAQVIDETTGLPVGTPVALNVVPGATAGTYAAGQLKAGAAISLPATEIEKAIGVQLVGARPRIRITAPTNGMNVQSFLFTPNGSFTEASGAQ